MTVTEINNRLQRTILDGKDFNSLMPSSDCSSVVLGTGTTDFGIQEIAKWAKKYQHHTVEVSQVFRKKTLKQTCQAIHWFAYNHFQYKLDGASQLLRSPACAWKQRHEGIDCKSYSILVSTVLLNLGIPHYLRRIKQNNDFPNAFTHIYVIVPKDGKNLKNGYFTIDGTIANFVELPFLEFDDIFMEPKGAGLGNPSFDTQIDDFTGQTAEQIEAYIGQVSTQIKQQASQVAGAITSGVSSVASLFGPVGAIVSLVAQVVGALVQLYIMLGYDPCKNSDYDPKEIGHRLKYEFLPKFKKTAGDLYDALEQGTEVGLVSSLNDLLKEIDLAIKAFEVEKSEYNANKCGVETLKTYAGYVSQMHKVVSSLYETLIMVLKVDFNVEEKEVEGYTNERTWYFIVPVTSRLIPAKYRKVEVYKQNENLRQFYPYGSELKFKEWARLNRNYLNLTYSDYRGDDYYNEIKGFGAKISEIRRKIYLSSVYRKRLEDELRERMGKIYLKYDTAYAQTLKTDFQADAMRINQNIIDFRNEIAMIKEQKRIAEINRQNNSKLIADANGKNIATVVLGLGGMYLVSDLMKSGRL